MPARVESLPSAGFEVLRACLATLWRFLLLFFLFFFYLKKEKKKKEESSPSTLVLAPLRDEFLIKRLLPTRLVLLNTRIFVPELRLIVLAESFLQEIVLSFFAGQPRAVEVRGTRHYLANLGILWGFCSQRLSLLLGIQDVPHAEYLPVSLHLRREICFREVEPIVAGSVLASVSEPSRV